MKSILSSNLPILLLLLYTVFANEISNYQFNFLSQEDYIIQQQNITNEVQHFDTTKRKTSSEGLQEFTPIIDTILQSEVKYYSFSVNTSSGLGEFYELLIFLSGNICTQPDNLPENQTSLAVYYSFNSTMFTNNEVGQMKLFKYGYFQALADLPIDKTTKSATPTSVIPNPLDDEKILYIAVRAPQNTNITASWTYQIGVSQNDLVFQWDDRSFGSIVDADDNTALIVTDNLTAHANDWEQFNASNSKYFLYIYSLEYKDYFEGMNNSWCAVRSGPAIRGPHNVESSFTTRNGGLQQQFMIRNLNESTKYIAYIVADYGGTNFGGALYHPFEFETMSGTACELIYDLEFCNRVAYSVPAIGDPAYNDDKNATKYIYDNYAQNLYENFTKALQQIPCDTVPEAIYSNLKSCEDCAESYKDWLCAVSIPRCNTKNSTGYKLRNSSNQRNPFMRDTISPNSDYYEVLPCVNVCHAIVKDCPADFGFLCPTRNESISLSYYWDLNTSDQWPSCNYVGKMPKPKSWGLKLIANNWLTIFVVIIIQIL
ncbi:MID1 [Candida jiufengensis]|uniref:MID1 n=1 Tax=Candida jiufengensis TaxID=497108 RepID=UPI0022242788|nr:MID1 [Candida jiufengensis]KAI5956577.1 MID1 [Candida jiufengensis]